MAEFKLARRGFIGLAMATLAAGILPAHGEDRKLRVGITLHPYYSFVANIVGDRAEIVPLIAAGLNPHGYQPQADDMKRAATLDVLVVNGIGHDEWAFDIIEAAGVKDTLPLVFANAGVAMIPIGGANAVEKVVNPHTFVSTIAAVQQVYEIARRLGEIDPPNAEFYRTNARAYAGEIRKLRAEFMSAIAAKDKTQFHAATMHAGYDYLFQEFGLRIEAIIEPRHGVSPTPKQLAQTIADIKASGVNVLFAEKYFTGNLAETVQRESGVRVYTLSHISDGAYTADKFMVEMRENIETVAVAIDEAGK